MSLFFPLIATATSGTLVHISLLTCPDIAAIIETRMSLLGERLQHTLQVCAVSGSDFTLALLRYLDSSITSEELEALIEADFLLVVPESEMFFFKHNLTFNAAYHQVPFKRRQKLHDAIVAYYQVQIFCNS